MVKYASVDELMFAIELSKLKIKYKEQPSPFIIDRGFTTSQGKTYKDMKYIADFIFNHNEILYIIEIKGWSMFDTPIKYRLLEKTIFDMQRKTGKQVKFCKLKLKGSTKDATQQFYNYSNKTNRRALNSKNKSKINSRLKETFFVKEGILSLDTIKSLKRPKTYTYESVCSQINEDWYKENIDNSEVSAEYFNDKLESDYIAIGNVRVKDISKYKFVRNGGE